MSEWQKVRIGDVAIGIYDGPHATPPPCEIPGHYFLGIPQITPTGHIDLANPRYIAASDYGRWTKRVTPRHGDVVFSYEATLNLYAQIPEGMKCCLGRRMGLVRPDPKKLDYRFLYYYFFSPEWRSVVKSRTLTGATVDRLPIKTFPDFPITLPPLPTQKRIADILSAYDDLIENNRRRMEILEESARLIYRKMFGTNKKRTNLLHLEDFVERTISGDWGKESPDRKCTEKIMCLRGADIPSLRYRDFGKGIVRFVTPQHVEERAMKDGDLFVEMSGGSPTQATGRVGLVSSRLLRDAELPVLCTNFCRVVRPKSGHAFFLYLAWLDLYDQDLMFMFEHSAIALKNFDLDLFLKKILVVKPEDSQLRDFNEKIAGVLDQMDVLGGENRRLIKARDMLLPKLINGRGEYGC